MTDLVNVRRRFNVHRADARRRGIGFLFDFETWWDWWQVDNRWEKRGRGRGRLSMCRIGDAGPYHPDNVYCGTFEQNQADVPTSMRTAVGFRSHVTRKARGVVTLIDNRGALHPRSKRVATPIGEFESGRLAAEALGVSSGTVYYRIKTGLVGFHYVDA